MEKHPALDVRHAARLLYAFPAGLVLLWSWRERFFSGDGKEENVPALLGGAAALLDHAVVSPAHLHFSSRCCSDAGCCSCFVRWFAGLDCLGITHVFRLIVWSLVPATVVIALITGFFKSSSLVHLPADWTWMYGEQPQFAEWATKFAPHFLTGILGRAACWTVNFGVFPPLVGVLVYKLIRQFKTPSLLKAGAFVIPSALIFIFSCSVMLAPWEWDNTKIMIWPYFTVLPFLWEHLIAKWNVWLRGACCFALWFSGFISLLGGIDGSHTGYDLARRSELDAVAAAVRQIPPTALLRGFPHTTTRSCSMEETWSQATRGIFGVTELITRIRLPLSNPCSMVMRTGSRQPVTCARVTSSGTPGGKSISEIFAAMETKLPKSRRRRLGINLRFTELPSKAGTLNRTRYYGSLSHGFSRYRCHHAELKQPAHVALLFCLQ